MEVQRRYVQLRSAGNAARAYREGSKPNPGVTGRTRQLTKQDMTRPLVAPLTADQLTSESDHEQLSQMKLDESSPARAGGEAATERGSPNSRDRRF